MKLLDIDNTVAKGVENIAKMGMSMLTLHAYPKAMAAGVEAAKGSGLCLLGVTVLTSMDANDVKDAGYALDPAGAGAAAGRTGAGSGHGRHRLLGGRLRRRFIWAVIVDMIRILPK